MSEIPLHGVAYMFVAERTAEVVRQSLQLFLQVLGIGGWGLKEIRVWVLGFGFGVEVFGVWGSGFGV